MAEIEIDWGSKIFWTALIPALFIVIAFIGKVAGFTVIEPTKEEIEAMALVVLMLIAAFRMFANNKPSMIQAK